MNFDVTFQKTKQSFPANFGVIHNVSDGDYEQGYEDGKTEANAELNALLAVAPFLTKVQELSYDNDYIWGQGGGLLVGYDGAFYRYVVIMPFVTEIEDNGLVNLLSPHKGTNDDNTYAVPSIIFTSKTPPVIGRQSLWASNGGNSPPLAIFVPDKSIDAYKVATNLAEFADIIKPLSQYNAEEYWGDWEW